MLEDLTTRDLVAGETLFREGDSGDCGYLIQSGSIGLYTAGESIQQLRGIQYTGDFLGELALVGQRIRTTSAVAREPTTVLIVRRNDIDRRLSDSDPIVKEFLISILGVLRNMLLSNWDINKSSIEGMTLAAKKIDEIQSMTQALHHNEFLLYYQPILRLSDRKIAGFEALIRWNRPDYGLVPPAEFIPLAESSGAIVDIGRWVIAQACGDMKRLGLPPNSGSGNTVVPYISINLSGRQLTDQDLIDLVDQAIQENGLGAKQVKLEVTESELAQNIKAANELLLQFKLLGVTVALDDFGTGQSSLEYLHQFPADTLKLDRSFVAAIHEDRTAMTIVSNITRMAKELDMDVIAEGIEIAEVADTLTELGVDYGQGYIFARPMPFEDLIEFMENHSFC